MLGQNFQRLGAVIGGGLIAWLRPAVVAINNAMDGIISAVQRVVNALGKIFGWEMIVDTTGKNLIDDTEEVADAWDDATDAAKKYAKQLLGIDELNNLTTNDKGSGSGDDGGYGGMSGGNIIDPGGIEFKKFESDIDNLYDLGKKLSEAFANLLPDDWTEIYKKAANFGTGLADFLNGLIQPSTFFKVGKTIAGALMTAITSLASFSDRADWEQYGEALGEGINGFFEEFDGAKFALGLNKFASGVLKAIRKALKTVDWGKVWEDIVGFIKNLSPDTIKLVLGTVLIRKVTKWLFGGAALNALKTALGTAIANKLKGGITLSSLSLSIPKINIGLKPGTASGDVLWDWVYTNILTPFHEMLPSGLQSFIENTFAGAVGGGLIGSIVPGIGTVVGAIVGAIIGAFTSEPVEPLRKAIWNFLTEAFRLDNAFETWDAASYWFGKIKDDFEAGDWAAIGEDILQGIMGALLAPFEIISSPFLNLFEWIRDGIKDIFGIHSPAEEMKPIGENIVLGILDGFGLVDFMKKVTDWWDENVAPWFTFDRWAKLGQGIYDGLTTKWNEFTSYFELDDIWGFITDTFSLDTWTGYGSDILDGLSTKWNEFTSLFKLDDIWGFIQEKFSLDSWTFSSISEGLSSSFNSAWEAVKQGWNDFADWLEKHMTIKLDSNNPITAGISKMFGGATEVQLIKLPRFEYGGFPNQGSLFVAGETYGQSEWVGNVNGKTGVVSGYEITDISRTIRDTSEAEMALMRSQNEILMGILQKEFGISKDAIGEAARSYGKEYYNRTGNQAFSY